MDDEFDPSLWATRLNLGCGFDRREGYLNVDLQAFHHPDLVADVTDLRLLPDAYYVEVLANDVLEHLPRHATDAVLSEWNRVMCVGGVLKIQVPSLFDLVDLFRRDENLAPPRQELLLQCLFGAQAYTGDTHLTSFTRPLLEHQLAEAGFDVVTWHLRDEWLFEVEATKARPSTYTLRWRQHADLLANHDIDTFLERSYTKLLGRSPDPSGMHHYRTALANGRTDFRRVIEELENSLEARSD